VNLVPSTIEIHRIGSLTAEIGAIADETLTPEQEAVILATLRGLPEPPDPCSPEFQERLSRVVADAMDIARSLPREECEPAFRAVLDGMDALAAAREGAAA
jgi:hypothetical protein